MGGILRWLSTGAISDAIARAAGWSPVGCSITLSGAEGPAAASLEGRSARVIGMRDGVMIAELRPGHDRRADGLSRVNLTPRHAGWTPFSLMLTGIAVVVLEESADTGPRQVGIAMARLARDAAVAS